MNLTQEQVRESLRAIQDPDLHRDIVSLGFIKEIEIQGGAVSVTIELTTPACPVKEKMQGEAEEILRRLPGVSSAQVSMTASVPTKKPREKQSLPGVRNIVAVSACKGGVGKTTVSVNLALALRSTGAAVGLLDADVYGPNVPLMLGLANQEPQVRDDKIVPYEAFGLKAISIGLVLSDEQPLIWRGPMVHSAVTQFLRGVAWGELDYLIIDLPPGTGDAQLTLMQSVPLSGAVIVTTPQAVALLDGKKGIAMFRKMGVPVLGIVENMSAFACPHCHAETPIFDQGGGRREAERLDIPFLGAVPLDPRIRLGGDTGRPIVIAEPGTPAAKIFHEMAGAVAARISTENLTESIAEHGPEATREAIPT